jgi:hypothetical protein
MKKIFIGCIAMSALALGATAVVAQTSSTGATPTVSIADITSVIYPLPMPGGGGPIDFTYRVTNPGTVSLDDVSVVDDHCSAMSDELGDTNGNHLLDPGETWIYTCVTTLIKTTTHTATVTAYANGLKTVNAETAMIDVPNASSTYSPSFPNDGSNPKTPNLPNNGTNPGTLNITILVWEIFGGILAALIIIYFFITRKKK